MTASKRQTDKTTKERKNSQPNNPPDGAGAAAAPPNENPVLNGGGFPAGVCGVSGGVDGAPPPKLNADESAADVPPPVVEAGVDVPKVVVVEGPQVTMVAVLWYFVQVVMVVGVGR